MRIEFYDNSREDALEEEIEATRNIVDQLNEYLPQDLHQIRGIRKGATVFDSIYFIDDYPDQNYTIKVGVEVIDQEIYFSVSSAKQISIVLRNESVRISDPERWKNLGIFIIGKKFTFTL